MKTLLFAFSLPLIFVSLQSFSQEPFPIKQLTNEPVQVGFATWLPDGKELIYANTDIRDTVGNMGVWKLSLEGKPPIQIYSGKAEHPQISPDGKHIIFDAEQGNDIHMIPATGGEAVDIIPDSIKIFRGGLPLWSPDGNKIAFMESEKQRLLLLDRQTKNIRCVFQSDHRLPMPCCFTKDGKGIYIGIWDKDTYESEMWIISIEDNNHQQIIPEIDGFYRYADLSPDGKWLAFAAIEGENLNLFVMPSKGGKAMRLTSEPRFNGNPRWSPDGRKIAFNSTRTGSFDIWLMEIDIDKLTAWMKEP